MKASELILALQALIDTHGDRDVQIPSNEGGHVDCSEVRLSQDFGMFFLEER